MLPWHSHDRTLLQIMHTPIGSAVQFMTGAFKVEDIIVWISIHYSIATQSLIIADQPRPDPQPIGVILGPRKSMRVQYT